MASINVQNPLLAPYPTGSYLIFDDPGGDPHFRSASELAQQPYRASGSRQVDLNMLTALLVDVVDEELVTRIHLVDLREETHGYMDIDGSWGRAISWYADNDWGNVGVPQILIEKDEHVRLDLLAQGGNGRVFTIESDKNDNRQQDRVLPLEDMQVRVVAAYTEARATRIVESSLGVPVRYLRIPVTDHCAPTNRAMLALEAVLEHVAPTDWVHFHCHGGDGRTTTFLALLDILQWKGALPPIETFAERQCALFPYCLDPAGVGDCKPEPAPWKLPLAAARWDALGRFLEERREMSAEK